MATVPNLIGKRFGQLSVVSRAHNDKHRKSQWLCLCDCGNHAVVGAAQLKRKITQSCGCIRSKMIGALNRTHGCSRTSAYRIWKLMRHRCNNPKDAHYNDYGGRGIKVCQRWQQSFEAFANDMGVRPNGYQLDRIDNDGDYCPENCRWATIVMQRNNTRVNRRITHRGITKTVAEWARACGLPYDTLMQRFLRKWDITRALEEPLRVRNVTE